MALAVGMFSYQNSKSGSVLDAMLFYYCYYYYITCMLLLMFCCLLKNNGMYILYLYEYVCVFVLAANIARTSVCDICVLHTIMKIINNMFGVGAVSQLFNSYMYVYAYCVPTRL